MKKLLYAVALATCAVFGANAATFRVAGTGGTHESIQDAIDAASDGDTILVGQGTYEAINTQGKKITIRSECGAEKTKIVARTGWGVDEYGEVTAAMLISEETFGQVGDSEDPDYEEEHTTYKYDVVNEWKTWTPADLPCSTLEGFTIEVESVGRADQVGIVGGRIKNCRLVCADGVQRFNLVQLAVIENSLIEAGYLGMWMEDGVEESPVELLSDCILRNCTVYTGSELSGQMENTIVYGRGDKVRLDEGEKNEGKGTLANWTLANCVFYGVNYNAKRTGVTIADPLFVDAANGDFRLQAGSPCIDKGGTTYGDFDLDGNPRVCNGKVDVGCYEYQTFDPVAWPSWVIGTWAGQNEGFYEMTLNPSGVYERWVDCEEGLGCSTNAWKGMKITDQADCHFVMTCWYWNPEHDKCNVEMILRKEGCSHYDKSSYSETSDTFDSGIRSEWMELTKLEMNTAPAEGWPEWVIGTWSGEILNYVPDKRETFTGTYTLTVSATGTNEKYVFDNGGVINHNDDLKGWVVTDKADCHVVGTCWCWNDEKDDWFDAEYVFRNTACSHYAQSSFSSIMHAGDSSGKDTCEVANLKKDGGDPTPSVPYVAGDNGATITGDASSGWTVTPSESATEVVVTIPDGVDAAKVTVVVSPETKRVTPNGAAVKVMRGEADITDYLDIPAADASGVIDLNAAMVKEEIANAVLSVEEGAEINLSAENPTLTTADTMPGLKYQLYEGATLSDLKAGDSTVGDGSPWTPTITEKGGSSGFYTVQVTK